LTRFNDLSGNRYDMLSVIRRVENSRDGYVQYLCVCDCGNYKIIKADNLRNGHTHSCGCLKKKMMADKQFKHGGTGGRHNKQDRLYSIWRSMISRCYFPSATEYEYYGGRGITVCNEWHNDYSVFRNWAINNGYSDKLTIDRIDNNGNYDPINCRWVTMKTQMNNKNNNHLIEYNGQVRTLTEWAELIGISRNILSQRINRYHWPIERALTQPVKRM